MGCNCANGYVEAEQVDPRNIPGSDRSVRGMGQAASGGFTYYTPGGGNVSVNLPGPAPQGSFSESIREWLQMDSLVAGWPNWTLVVAGIGLWLYRGERR